MICHATAVPYAVYVLLTLWFGYINAQTSLPYLVLAYGLVSIIHSLYSAKAHSYVHTHHPVIGSGFKFVFTSPLGGSTPRTSVGAFCHLICHRPPIVAPPPGYFGEGLVLSLLLTPPPCTLGGNLTATTAIVLSC